MRSGKLAATIAISLIAACGGSSSYGDYGDYDDEGDESRTDPIEARDGGGSDARVRDGGAARTDAGSGPDGGGVGSGGNDDDDDDDADDDDDGAADDGGTTPDGSADAGGADSCATLTYQTFGQQFLTNYCLSCHGAASPSAGINLTTLANVVRRKAGVKAQVTGGGMPLGGKQPSAAERTRFGQWIDCGPK